MALTDLINTYKNKLSAGIQQGLSNIQGNVQALSSPTTRNQWVSGVMATPINLGVINKPLNQFVARTTPLVNQPQRLLTEGILSSKARAVPIFESIGQQLGNKQLGQDIGYGVRGALSLTPFQSFGNLTPKLSEFQKQSAPITDRQQFAQSLGQGLYGSALTAPLAGGKTALATTYNVGNNMLAGSTTGALMQGVADLLSGQGLSTKSLKQGALQGLQNSWVLPITNTLTDKAISSFAVKFPSLSKYVGEAATDPFKAGQIKEGFKRVLIQSLAQVPAENTAFTALNQLDDNAKGTFIENWIKNIPGSVAGNILSAGATGSKSTLSNKASREAVTKAFDNTWREWNIPVTMPGQGAKSGQRITAPMWKWKAGLVDDGSMRVYKSDVPKPDLKVEPTNVPQDLLAEARKYGSAEEFLKSKQLDFINKNNPMTDQYHTGIRSTNDIKTFKETLNDPESFVYPDFSKTQAEKAVKNGKITIYSSKPLSDTSAQFVTPSKMNASDYAGGGKIYSKEVNIDDVSWISGDEGQYTGNIKSQLTSLYNQAKVITQQLPQQPTTTLSKPMVETLKPSEIPQSQVKSTVKSVVSVPTVEAQVAKQVSSTPYFNTDRLNVSDTSKAQVTQAVEEAKPAIEKLVGKRLSNKEAIQQANMTAKTLNKAVTRDETKAWEAALLKARQKLAKSAESGVVDKEYLDNLVTVKSLGTDIARKLQSFSIGADPKEVTSKQAILEAVLKVNENTDEVLKAAQGVDFNNLQQATNFYRQFVAPKTSEWLDLLRYNSMLSSPNTHINNFSSNLQGTGIIAPIEKTVTGVVDAVKSAITGAPREYSALEGPAYLKGYIKSVSEARQKFADVMSGKALNENPDLRAIPLGTTGGAKAVEGVLSYPMKLLEASDQFFTTLAKGGIEGAQQLRTAKGLKNKMGASDEAAKRLFRSELGDNQGSYVLDAIDTFANTIQRLKNVDNPVVKTIAKYTFPFVKTPTNVLKQGVEYAPFGITTLPGAKNKTEQLAKAIMGTSIAAGSALLLGTDRITWAEPTDAKKKAAFRAAGMQPYAVKIGNNWVSYTKLHPAIAFNLALVSALKNAEDNKKLDANQVDTVLSGIAKWWQFFADNSMVKNIGDIVNTAQGDVEGAARYLSNYPQQLIPFRALMGWVERLTDPYQRKVDPSGSILEKQLQQIATQIPGLAQTIPARLDTQDKPIENQNRLINAFSPAKVTTEKPEQKQIFQNLVEKSRQTSLINQAKEKMKTEKQDVSTIGGVYLIKQPNGDISTIDISKPIETPKLTGQVELDKKLKSAYNGKITSRINDIVKLYEAGQLDQTTAETKIKELQSKSLKAPKKVSVKKIKAVSLKMPKIKKIKIAKIKIKKPKKYAMKVKTLKSPKIKLTRLTT